VPDLPRDPIYTDSGANRSFGLRLIGHALACVSALTGAGVQGANEVAHLWCITITMALWMVNQDP